MKKILRITIFIGAGFCWFVLTNPAMAQGPMPEEGATLFPHGGLVSYGSTITMGHVMKGGSAAALESLTQPTFQNEMPLTFSWSFRRDFQFSSIFPIVNRRLELIQKNLSATGLGDAELSLKYRFLRRDSERGTTQASISIGPKLPSGATTRRDPTGHLLPVELQPGTGSLDLLMKFNMTYTGLMNFRRLVADPSFSYLLRGEGSQDTQLGDKAEARLWLHYRPLQTQLVGGEWFIGPTITWEHTSPTHRAGLRQPYTGSNLLRLGVTSYISPRGGLVFWAGFEFPVAQDWNGAPYEQSRRFHFGVTKQFVLQR